jgi:hypothetical protein
VLGRETKPKCTKDDVVLPMPGCSRISERRYDDIEPVAAGVARNKTEDVVVCRVVVGVQGEYEQRGAIIDLLHR